MSYTVSLSLSCNYKPRTLNPELINPKLFFEEPILTIRIIFMGTPDFAVPPLQALIDAAPHQGWRVVGIVTQPDRPKGRGKKLAPPPVKVMAEQAGLPVLQPETLKTEEAVAELTALKPDVIVVAAFGQILRSNVLHLPPAGCLNIHASLLPRWRGAAPITAAIEAGDAETGVTIMLMDEGLDTGPMLSQRAIPLTTGHTGGSLTQELAQLGAELLVDTLPKWLAGEIEPQPQNNELATKTRLLKKQDGAIDWSKSAQEIERRVRAFTPWPGAFSYGLKGQIKILSVEVAESVEPTASPGVLFKHNRNIYVATGSGAIRLAMVQPAGKTVMPAEAMLNGQPELLGSRLGSSEQI
jgi:methionyl-tRNA formyltransferase